MVKKSIDILRNNRVIILFFFLYEIVVLLILFVLYPMNSSQYLSAVNFNITTYLFFMCKLLMVSVLAFLFFILFYAGFGNMISEAVIQGKTSAKSFYQGIKKYFVKVLLVSLLTVAFSIALAIVISVITVIGTVVQVLSAAGSLKYMSLWIIILTLFIVMFVIPFILLWLPSIFIDDAKVIQSLKNEAKAGVKNYWKLVLTCLIILLPVAIYEIIFFDTITKGIIFTPVYCILLVVEGLISLVVLPIYFIIYQEYKMKLPIQKTP